MEREMTMVEKVARAISAQLEEYGLEAYEVAEADGRAGWAHEIARAAIDAMRDPTDEMLDAGQTPGWSRWEVRGRFNLMIDAALKEHEGEKG